VPQQGHATALALLALVGDRVLVDVDPATVDAGRRALEGELLGVPIELLQQPAAHAEGQVVGGVSGAGRAFEITGNRSSVEAGRRGSREG
jgi:hypothetical protein